VAEAEDCRPLVWFHRVRTENKWILCGFSHPTFFSGPLKPGACSVFQTARWWHSTSAHSSRMATVQPDRFGDRSA
jgi:hypothetical protein